MDGLLIVDKPMGKTSADVVRCVKKRLGCKTGHLGTLDPFATGVLPLCLGEGSKIAQFLNIADKEYVGQIRLGLSTDTGDPTGEITATSVIPEISVAGLQAAAVQFRGPQLQTPPMYSALKRQGTPLYKLARQGIEVEREAREIVIESLTLRLADPATIEFTVACSKGTYVRVLASDIARSLGTVGHLLTLRRTRFGAFDVRAATSLEDFESGRFNIVGLREALGTLREIVLDETAAQRARSGYEPLLRSLPAGQPGEVAKLVSANGRLAAVVTMDAKRGWRFARVFCVDRVVAAE